VFSISIKSSSYLGSFLLPSVTFSADEEPEVTGDQLFWHYFLS
jgi:hypothetical protein